MLLRIGKIPTMISNTSFFNAHRCLLLTPDIPKISFVIIVVCLILIKRMSMCECATNKLIREFSNELCTLCTCASTQNPLCSQCEARSLFILFTWLFLPAIKYGVETTQIFAYLVFYQTFSNNDWFSLVLYDYYIVELLSTMSGTIHRILQICSILRCRAREKQNEAKNW